MPTILALLAHAFLSVLAAAQPAATTHMMTCWSRWPATKSGGCSPDCPGSWHGRSLQRRRMRVACGSALVGGPVSPANVRLTGVGPGWG